MVMNRQLIRIWEKVLSNVAWRRPSPSEPVTFSLYLLEVLDEADFRALDTLERKLGERRATLWLDRLRREVEAMAMARRWKAVA